MQNGLSFNGLKELYLGTPLLPPSVEANMFEICKLASGSLYFTNLPWKSSCLFPQSWKFSVSDDLSRENTWVGVK